jgi:hypothetical protein
MPTSATVSPFLDLVFAQCDGLLELRVVSVDRRNTVERAFVLPDDAHAVTRFFGAHLHDHCYFGVATRCDASSGTAENCLELPVLFADIDFKTLAEPLARQRLANCPMPPTALLHSGGGLHAYWLLREPVSLAEDQDRLRVRSLLRRMAVLVGGDLHSAEPARCLRLPGSLNGKYDPSRQARVEVLEPDRAYNLDDFDEVLSPEPVEASVNGTPFIAPEKILDGQRNRTLFREARSLKARNFCREALTAALHAENLAKCVPPLSDEEVETIAANAWSQPDRASFTQNSRAESHHDGAPVEATVPEMELVAFQIVTPPTSFVSRYIQYAQRRTYAPQEAHEALAFGILSALAPSVRLPIATNIHGWRLALWLLYLVNSTAGRKSTVIDLAADFVREVLGEAAMINWEGSPQGLLQRLQTRDGQAAVFLRDEYSALLASINHGGHLAGLPQLLIKAFDGSVLENIRTRKRGADGQKHSDSDRVENPYLVQFAAAPWDSFVQWATIDNVLDGFLARFVIVTGSASVRPLAPLTDAIRAARLDLLGQAWAYHARA